VQRLRSWPLRLAALVFLPVAATSVAPARGAAMDFPPLRSDSPPYFNAEVAISVDAEGKSQVAVTVTVPYSELQWVKLTGGYGAGAEFSVVFQPRGKGRGYGDAWVRRIAVPSFESTRSPNAVVLERRNFATPPGTYDIRVAVEDLDAQEESSPRSASPCPITRRSRSDSPTSSWASPTRPGRSRRSRPGGWGSTLRCSPRAPCCSTAGRGPGRGTTRSGTGSATSTAMSS
jgi:hypothetical protein